MDVLDAGVWVTKWEARVPKTAKMTLWGPLQAKEMGLTGWEVQDGGETGFVMHHAGAHLTMGRGTASLIFVRRLERAFLTVYFAGYPADAPEGQRKLDMQKLVNDCELFLKRLCKEPVQFQFMGEMTLVDNSDDAKVLDAKGAGSQPGQLLGSGRRIGKKAVTIDADTGKEATNLAKKEGIDQVGPDGRPSTRVWEV